MKILLKLKSLLGNVMSPRYLNKESDTAPLIPSNDITFCVQIIALTQFSLSLSVSLCVSLSLSVSLFVSVYLLLSVTASVFLSLSVFLTVHL